MKLTPSLRLFIVLQILLLVSSPAWSETYYVDAKAGDDSRPGTSESAPWKSLRRVNDTVFQPGDAILLRRGSKWQGMLSPKGSGEAGRPIRIGAYGRGPLPIIDGAGNEAALRLFNQQFWEISNIETTGGDPYGLHISGDNGTLRHFQIRDVVVHDVTGKLKTKNAGLIAIVMGGPNQTFEDVLIDGATAYKTSQWSGITIAGDKPDQATLRSNSVTVRNCVVHDVFGDGIVLFQVRKGLIERNVTWNTGMQPSLDIGTPNAIWTWKCDNCLVQFNEGYFADSPGIDGGVYDIDYGNHDNTYQYNYAHDSQGYCVAVFAAGSATTNSVVRYNVCVNNGRSPRLAELQGDIFVSTWNGGWIDGMKIHNNTVFWNPPTDAPALRIGAEFKGSRPNLVANNLFVSSVPTLISTKQPVRLDNNLYWYSGTARPVWDYAGKLFTSLDEYRKSTGQDGRAVFANPLLVIPESSRPAPLRHPVLSLGAGSPARDGGIDIGEMGGRDILGRPAPGGPAVDIGAFESQEKESSSQGKREKVLAPDFQLQTPQGDSHSLAGHTRQWTLISFLEGRDGVASADSRSQVVFLQSMHYQYRGDRLKVLALVSQGPGPENDQLFNLPYDWALGGIPLLLDPGNATAAQYGIRTRPTTLLVDPEKGVVARWNGFASAVEIGLTLRALLGPPAGAAPMGE